MLNPQANSWILTGCCQWHLEGGCSIDKCCMNCPSYDAKKFAIEKGIHVQKVYVGTPHYDRSLREMQAALISMPRRPLLEIGSQLRVCSPGTHDSKTRVAKRIMAYLESMLNPIREVPKI